MSPVTKKQQRQQRGRKQQQASAPGDGRPSVLVVDDEPSLIELVDDVVGRQVDCRVIAATSLKQARKILASGEPVELLVADVNLPDGDGMSLLPSLREHRPHAAAIVITGSPSVDGAIAAMRHGALDFVPKPFSAEQITERVRGALARQAVALKAEKRLERLREAVRRLGAARRVVGKKVDLLCNDLVGAYTDLSKQFDTVRMQEGFRSVLASAKDMEQLLCHAMDWMLRQMGYCNVAIWLASDDQQFQLGAYMKYTVPGEPPLITAMRHGIVPLVQREGIVRMTGEESDERLTPAELEYLSDQAVLAANCTYLSEPLAAVVLFRDGTKPFTDEDEDALRTVGPIFACALAAIAREALPGEGAAGDEGNGGTSFGDESADGPGRGKADQADWWKRGEAPPF